MTRPEPFDPFPTPDQRGLYAVLDVDALEARRQRPLAAAEAMLSGGARVLQLRAKHLGTRPLLALAEAIARLARAHRAPFFVNDRVDIALAVGAGVHVGQADLPLAHVRRVAPELPVGVSTHDEAQLREAVAASPTYIAFGPVFSTGSKPDAEPVVGLEGVRRAAEISRGLPLVAIGGITVERAPAVLRAGATLVAAIAGLLPSDEASSGFALDEHAFISGVRVRVGAYDRASCS